jgi:hypothetical protein
MRTEGGGVGISASLFRPPSSVLRHTSEVEQSAVEISDTMGSQH